MVITACRGVSFPPFSSVCVNKSDESMASTSMVRSTPYVIGTTLALQRHVDLGVLSFVVCRD